MSIAEATAPKQRVVGRPFAPGQSGNPAGRPKGSRNRLADAFIADLAAAWEKHGVQALETCASEEPGTFLKVIAGLMPKDVNLNLEISASEFAGRFASAMALLGNEPDTPLPRKPLREIMRSRAINHER